MLEYLATMTKRQEKIDEIDKIGISRSKADTITEKFEELFDLRSNALKRDLVGMEEVKTRLKRKGDEMEDHKRAMIELAERKRRMRRESMMRSVSRVSTQSSPMPRRSPGKQR